MIAAGVLGRFGDEAGVCPPRPTARKPTPSAAVRRLQRALLGVAKLMRDPQAGTVADGLIGPNTTRATNYAMVKYAGGPAEFRTGKLTTRQVSALASPLTSYLEAVGAGAAVAPSPPAEQPSGESMPYYQQQPTYVPAGYAPAPAYYAPQPAGGLPPDQASLDVRAFIPAQYEHVRVDPTWVMIALGVGVAYLIIKNKEKKGRD